MKNKLYAIVGNPRSGTSLTCLATLKMFGEDRCLGKKFMDMEKRPHTVRQKPDLSPTDEYRINKIKKAMPMVIAPPKGIFDKRLEKMLDMNSEGFYECAWTVSGMNWSMENSKLWDKFLSMEEKPFAKLVNSGIANSDPRYIERIVYVNRHPREVAKSQEKLTGGIRNSLPKGEVIHSPDNFINSTTHFCKWYVEHGKNIPILLIDHKDLLNKPEETIKKMAEFYDLPHNNAWEVVRKDLYRSKPQDTENPQWEDAEKIYDLMGKMDFQGVLDYVSNPEIMTHKVKKEFHCHRIGRKVTLAECNNCINKQEVKANFIISAEKIGIKWEQEPCALECGALDKKNAISVEESIKNHSWLYENLKIGSLIAKMTNITGIDKFFENCKGCKKREKDWNNLFKIKRKI